MITTIFLFLFVLSVLVLGHEWGHYAAARKIGARVEEFGLGFPPRVKAWTDKKGMEWSLNLVPLGGFVKISGENGEDKEDPESFANKPAWAKIFVLSAGVMMNLVMAAILFSIGFSFGVPAITEGEVSENVIITDEAVRVTEVLPGSPAQEAGLKMGDEILSINGVAYDSGVEAREALHADAEEYIFAIDRQGEEMEISVMPAYVEALDAEGIGVAIVETGTARYPWYLIPVKGVETTYSYTGLVVMGFVDIFGNLFHGEAPGVELSGPVGIAQMTGDMAQLGVIYLLQFAAILSINLAVLNILPFPALDGGRILFVLAEAIRRKPNSQQFEAIVHNVGFLVLIGLVIFVTYKDILKFI